MSKNNTFERGRVKYVEPTNIYDSEGNLAVRTNEIIKNDLEDYCLAVDLAVIIPNRKSCGFSDESGEQLELRYSSDRGTISFSHGTDGYLTTNFTDVNLLNPQHNTNECLGITSIDVTYNAWQYPEVNIKFVDVRGASIMSPEEQAYQNKNQEGGSFYRALFTAPYPMFILKLKGFYGKGATYYLSVEDVKIALDASSGNYEIDVKFIGMMYRVYTDIPMTYICAAPYMEAGSSYWDAKVSSGEFAFHNADGTVTEMIKIPKLAEVLANASTEEEKMTAEEGDFVRRSDEMINDLTQLKKDFPLNDWEYDYDGKFFYNSFYSDTKKNITEAINNYVDRVNNCTCENKESFKSKIKSALGVDVKDNLKYAYFTRNENGELVADTKRSEIIIDDSTTTKAEEMSKKNGGEKWNVVFYYTLKPSSNFNMHDRSDITNIFDEKIIKATKEKEGIVENYRGRKNLAIQKALGFTPSIRNIYNLIFAHMDTFINTFYECTNNIKSQLNKNDPTRNLRNYDAAGTDLKVSETQVPPFTEFLTLDKSPNTTNTNGGENGVQRKKPIWLEDLNMGKNLEETKYVLDLLNGSNMLFSDIKKADENTKTMEPLTAKKNILKDAGYEAPTLNVTSFIPLSPYDLARNGKNGNPYEKLDLDSSDLVALILSIFATRAFNYLCTTDNSGDSAKDFGTLEAENLYLAVKDNISLKFLSFIETYAKKNGIFSGTKKTRSDFLKKLEDGKNTEWNFGESTGKQGAIFVDNGGNLLYNWQKDCFLPLNLTSLTDAKRNFAREKDDLSGDMNYIDTSLRKSSKKAYTCFSSESYIKSIFENIRQNYKDNVGLDKIQNKYNWEFNCDYALYDVSILFDGTGKDGTNKKIVKSKDAVKWQRIKNILKDELDTSNYYFSFAIDFDTIKNESSTEMKAFRFINGLPWGKCIKDKTYTFEFKNGINLKSMFLLEASKYWAEDNGVTGGVDIKLSNRVSNARKEAMKEKFIEWANGEFKQAYEHIINIGIYDKATADKQHKYIIDINKALELKSTNLPASDFSSPIEMQKFLRNIMLDFYTELDFNSLGENFTCKRQSLDEAFKGFMNGLSTHYSAEMVSQQKKDDAVKAYNTKAQADPFKNDDVKLATYLTLKNLYDKWLCFPYKGRRTWELGCEESDFESFMYIDSFYHDIGNELLVNITKVNEWLRSCFPTAEVETTEGLLNYVGKSVYQFLSEVAQDSGGVLMAFPQKIGATTSTFVDEMFNVMPYNSDWETDSSCFVFMYSYKPSEHLGNDDYLDDGIDLTSEEVESSLSDNGYFIPAFGVTYAKQNQAFFKNIVLNTEKATTTEASIRATMDIAARGGSDADGNRTTSFFGQDLYQVRTNYAYECEFDMMGCIQVMPLMYFQLNNVPFWRGAYMIYKVSHNITAGDMTTHVTGVRICKNSLPIVEGTMITTKDETRMSSQASAPINGKEYNYDMNNVVIHDDSVTFDPNSTLPYTPEYDINNVTNKKPVICLLPAHNGKQGKTEEWYWSSMVVDKIASILRSFRYKDGTNYNVQRLKTIEQGSGYSGRHIRATVRKFGQDSVISVVPHWNGSAGQYIVPYTGNKDYQQRADSLKLCEYFIEAAKVLVNKGKAGEYVTMPLGMMDAGVLKTKKLIRVAEDGTTTGTDPAAGQNCACLLSENFFADYGPEGPTMWAKYGYDKLPQLKKELDPSYSGERHLTKKDDNGRYVTGVGWLTSQDGIDAIVEAHVEAIVRYINSL